MTFPAYPSYRDSGVEWLGAVPSYWESWKISHAFGELGSGTTPPTSEAEWYEDGTVPWVTTGELREGVIWETKKLLSSTVLSAFSALRLHPAGSLAIAMYGATIGRLGILGVDATTNQACCLLTRPKHLHVKFTFYWLLVFKQSIIDLYASGGGQPNINQEIIANLKVPAPGIPEQTQIARFLDHETARIDALIEEQQRLIELLKEKRQVVISHAVTKGLDATVPMKDSGVEWLGEVPAHWKVSKLGHYAQILTGFPFPSASFSHDESDVRLLRGANIGVGSLKWIDTVYWSLSEGDNLSSYLMEEGQIVLGMDRPWISEGMRIARVTKEDMPCLLLQRVAAISPSAELDDEYLFCLLASELFKTYVEPDLTGVSVPHISPEQIMSFQISVPEIGEQRRISSFIRNQLDQMTALFEQASESVELLQERRSALISAAVTGKIDVRGWQPPASAQTPELEQEAV
jgi:type I restriction enzyme S subunit